MKRTVSFIRAVCISNAFIGITIFAVISFVYLRTPLPTPPGIDFGIYTYQAQQMFEGVSPYVSIFNGKFPLGTFILLPGIWLARLIGWHDIHGIQFLYAFVGGAFAAMIYLISAKLTRSKLGAVLAGFYYLNFKGAWKYLFSYDPKTTASLFLLIFLFFLIKKKWFWVGLSLSCVILCWQPAVIFLIPCLATFAITQKTAKIVSLLKLTAGCFLPFILLSLYFVFRGTFWVMFEATVIYPLFYHYNATYNPLTSNIFEYLTDQYVYDSVFFFSGVLGLTGCYLVNIFNPKNRLWFDRLPVALCFITIAVWSCVDFRHYRDLYPILPFACFGAAWAFNDMVVENVKKRVIFASILLTVILFTSINPPLNKSNKEEFLLTVRQLRQVVDRYAPNRRIVMPGIPDVAVYLNIPLSSRYAYWGGGHTKIIEKNIPGGVEALKTEMMNLNPEIIFMHKGYVRAMNRTVRSKYRVSWAVQGIPTFVKKGLSRRD